MTSGLRGSSPACSGLSSPLTNRCTCIQLAHGGLQLRNLLLQLAQPDLLTQDKHCQLLHSLLRVACPSLVLLAGRGVAASAGDVLQRGML